MRLGAYEVLERIGAGGMGEVFRGHDTVLKRDVALKMLPEAFAADPSRMARFQREAEVLASMNHPNIAHIYGIEQRALVMELVEGPTLADRIASGKIPEDEALAIAKQITDALEYAHEKGIVHRDLKPANIKLTRDGVVKVLDFGLAKATQAERYATGDSPTLTLGATQAGLILGTAAYMSPEQARGKDVDKRADIWAFGVVLHEMLTGKGLYGGEMVSDILAAVIAKEPEIGSVPERLRPVFQACLEKEPKKRLRDIGDVWRLVGQPVSPAADVAVTAPSRKRLGWVGWAAAIAISIPLAYLAYKHFNEETRILRMSVQLPDKATYGSNQIPQMSPDGRRLVFAATIDSKSQLWVRDLDSLESRPLPGSEEASYPFWSPDSRWVAFFAGSKLKKIDVTGGPALTICDASEGRGGSWSTRDVIIYGMNNGGLFRVAAAGGTAVALTQPDRAAFESSHRFPWFLPDGKHFLYTARSGTDSEKSRIYATDIDAKPGSNSRALVAAADSNAVYAQGYVLFARERTLMALPFDVGKLRATGEAAPIAEQIDYVQGVSMARFSSSENGVLLYTSGAVFLGGITQLTWFDRTGKPAGTVGAPGLIEWPSISPDGNTIAFDRREQGGPADVWLHDLTRGTETRFTFGPAFNQFPVWSPDGSHIAFTSPREGIGNMYQRATGGVAQDEALDRDSTRRKRPRDWSRDGKYIVEDSGGAQGGDIYVIEMAGEKKASPFIKTDFNEQSPRISPDGQWLAYASNESRRNEIYVSTFPMPGGKWQVSTKGGLEPAWSRDGRELYYISLDNKMVAVPVKPGPKFDPGPAKELFEVRPNLGRFDVSKDGRFLMAVPVEQATPSTVPMTVVVNWPAALKK